jgi:hypothetical protein
MMALNAVAVTEIRKSGGKKVAAPNKNTTAPSVPACFVPTSCGTTATGVRMRSGGGGEVFARLLPVYDQCYKIAPSPLVRSQQVIGAYGRALA